MALIQGEDGEHYGEYSYRHEQTGEVVTKRVKLPKNWAEQDGLLKHAKRWEPKQDTPIKKEYLSEWDKVVGKYSIKYKKYDSDSD